MPIDLDEITELEDTSVFKLIQMPQIHSDLTQDIIFQIPFYLDSDRTVIQRDGYTAIDILSDIGGLNGLFATFFTLILSVLNHNHFDSTLASQLYTFKDQKKAKGTKKKEKHDDAFTGFTPNKTNNVKEYFLDSLPPYLHCC